MKQYDFVLRSALELNAYASIELLRTPCHIGNMDIRSTMAWLALHNRCHDTISI